MDGRTRSLRFAVTTSLLALMPIVRVDGCLPVIADPGAAFVPDDELAVQPNEPAAPRHDDPAAPNLRVVASSPPPIVNPGPAPEDG